jgi:hypothetical protein
VSSNVAAAAWSAARVLTAVGPLDTETLLEAIDRSRRFRHRTPFTTTELSTALTAAGAQQGLGGQWHAPPDVPVPDRYRVIVERAAGRDLTRAGMIEILISAGYTRSSATGRMSSSHPLFERIGPNRYRLIETAPAPAGVTKSSLSRVGGGLGRQLIQLLRGPLVRLGDVLLELGPFDPPVVPATGAWSPRDRARRFRVRSGGGVCFLASDGSESGGDQALTEFQMTGSGFRHRSVAAERMACV